MKPNCGDRSTSSLLKLLVLVSLSSSCWFSGFAQDNIREHAEYDSENYKEELYLQTDRDLYISGEELWLKVYKLNALSKKPANLSKVVYLELLNSVGYPVMQVKLNVEKLSKSTSFILSDTLGSGNYLLRAYTNWMKNYSEKEFSFREISIINPFHKPGKINTPAQKQFIDTLLFYPEGGVLVSGIESRVGFRAIDESGRPQEIEAALVNEETDTICLVRTGDNGFGTFSINPDHKESYRLLYTSGNGETQTFPLGRIENSGIILSLNHSELKLPLSFRINKSPDFTPGENRYFILIKSRGLVKFRKEINLLNEMEWSMNRSELPDGVSQIVLTNENGEQLSSRWIYNGSDQSIFFDIKFDKPEYGSREKVKVKISATDREGKPMETDLSVSIAKSCSVNEHRMNIANRAKHLSSLRTGISSYKLKDINDALLFYSDNDIDLKEIYLPELEGKILSGKMKYKSTEDPVENEDLVFSIVGKTAKCQFYKTNEFGDFHFIINETGLQEIVIQPLGSGLSDYFVELEPDFINSFNHLFPGSLYLDTSKLEELNKSIISMQIKNIYQSYWQNNHKVTAENHNISFYNEPENAVILSDFIQLTTVREVIKEIVPRVYTQKKDGEFFFQLLSDIDGQVFENKPLVIVDGIPFNDIEQILRMSPTEIERIEVLNLKYFIDDQVFDGIIHFITKEGNLRTLDFDHSIFRQAYNTFCREVKFNSPDYSNDSLVNNHLPDFRNTLYWNPDLHTQNDGVVSFEFFTSDETSDYTLCIEGISPEGKTGALHKQIPVN